MAERTGALDVASTLDAPPIKGKRGPVRGPCPTCGTVFRSYGAKIYCSLTCYQQSPEMRARLRAQSAALQARQYVATGHPPTVPLEGACLQCGQPFALKPTQVGKKKYCSRRCYRAFMAARFDRWIANPESIALPQCYDEFLTQGCLPCLVAGCDWVGEHLGMHVNLAHGLTARQFKRLAGFNVTTGLVTPEVSAMLASRAHLWDPPTAAALSALFGHPPHRTTPSLEGREHLRKSKALLGQADSGRTDCCRQCGVPITLPLMGIRYYCSVPCRTAWEQTHAPRADLACALCGTVFLGSPGQTRRAAKHGKPVFCGSVCRQRHNGQQRRKA